MAQNYARMVSEIIGSIRVHKVKEPHCATVASRPSCLPRTRGRRMSRKDPPVLPRQKSQTEKRRNLHASHWLIEYFSRIYAARKITFLRFPWALLRVCASGIGHSAPPWPCLPLSSDPWTARHAGDSGQSHRCPYACRVSLCESSRHTSDRVSLPAG